MNIIFTRASFFFLVSLFVCFFHFHRTLFSWACGSLREPRKFSLFVHSLVCPITHSFLDEFQPNLVQHFPQVCSTCYTIFSLKKTLECVCERLLHCRLISAITWTPDKSFACTFSYTIYIDVSFCTESFKKVVGLSFSKLSFKVASVHMLL